MSSSSSSSSKARPPVSYGGEHRLRSENLAFDIDVWYPPVQAHTAHTVCLPLCREEALAIVAYYNVAIRRDISHQFTTVHLACLKALEARIDRTLKDNFASSEGAFLRLCGRSPKDGEPTDPVARAQIWEMYERNLRQVLEEEELSNSNSKNSNNADSTARHDNARVVAVARTSSHALRVRTGADAMALLLNSERVFSDMLDWIHYGEPEQIVLRKWQGDAYNISTEFRLFVRHGKVLGISQYEVFARHAYLQEKDRRAVVIKAILDEWLKLKDCIETIDGSYCADFGVDLHRETSHLIELSPFRRCTGPALFAWQDESTLVILDGTDVLDDPLYRVGYNEMTHPITMSAALRVRAQVVPQIGDLVDHNWDWKWSPDRIDVPHPFSDVKVTAVPKTISQAMPRIWNLLFLPPWVQLFVYGTLKRNCHWHSKYMTGAQFVGNATTTQPISLVIGQCGVPYMIANNNGTNEDDDQAMPVRGELWKVSKDMLRGIDEFEGIDKDHYIRTNIAVSSNSGASTEAFCYFYAIKPGASNVDESLRHAPRVAEYTVEEQRKRYKPIHHIQVKQLQYLGEEVTT